MFNVSRISKNLIAVSLVSTVLVVWLGTRYLSDAHKQFSGATQLERSVIHESTLFDLLNNLDMERATTQSIFLSVDQYDDQIIKLRSLSSATKKLFNQARQEIKQSLSNSSAQSNQRYSEESIEFTLADIEDRLKRISASRFVIAGQSNRAANERDENVRMQLFDLYVLFIESVNKLRTQTHTYPEKNYVEVLEAHDSRDSIWAINESLNQTITLISSLLTKRQNSGLGALSVNNLAFRLLQQHENTTTEFTLLDDMVKNGTLDDNAADALSNLKAHYTKVMRPEVKLLILGTPAATNPAEKLTEWKQISSETKQNVRILREAILSNTVATAGEIKSDATRNLSFNALLVFICMLMAYATFSIGRRIQHQANHDELTGLPNRRLFNDLLESLFKQTDTTKNEKLVLMTLDLNGFKSINDTMGHTAGDILLVQVAERLKKSVEGDISIARIGGDEFAAAFVTKNEHYPLRIAHNLSSTFDQAFKIDEGYVNIDTSIGYSSYPNDASTIEQLQITSDFAMFSAKQSGRKTIQSYDHNIAAKFEKRIKIEKDLQTAIEDNSLELYYQPQVNFNNNNVTAVEALLRWNHPKHGIIPPDDFISIAEDTGMMPMLGKWVLNEACRQAAEWRDTSAMDIRVAVNVSVHQIVQIEFVQDVFDTIERHGIPTSCLELEVTESVVMTDMSWIAQSLKTLKDQGIKIALDDFGTGYSSLSQLQELPLDTLKIDRSFIDKLDGDSVDLKSITATIASIAQIFKLETVAEGIENENQLREANKLGIDMAQGYYYSRPLSSDEVVDAVKAINNAANDQQRAA